MSLQRLYARAAELNADLVHRRPDLEWCVIGGRLRLETNEAWSRRNAARIERETEQERQEFIHRKQHPIAFDE